MIYIGLIQSLHDTWTAINIPIIIITITTTTIIIIFITNTTTIITNIPTTTINIIIIFITMTINIRKKKTWNINNYYFIKPWIDVTSGLI